MQHVLHCFRQWFVTKRTLLFALASWVLTWPGLASSEDARLRSLGRLQHEIEQLRRAKEQQEKRLEELERELRRLKEGVPSSPTGKPEEALDRALESGKPPRDTALPQPKALWSATAGGIPLRLIDLSLDAIVAGGWSTAGDEDLNGRLQAGGHDPVRRGFTLQQAELSLMGAVDPYFVGEAHVLFSGHGAELEEAFLTTSSLPYGLQVEAGLMLTEYGLLNPIHPHAWDWVDQAVILSRLLGPEGLRSPGVRLGWLTPLPWFSEVHVGAQNANEGELTASFLSSEAVGGRPATRGTTRSLADLVYLIRWENFWNLTSDTGLLFGANSLHGPNSTGGDARTWIYGADLKLRWRPQNNFRGWPFFLWQTEVHKRDYTASYYLPAPEVSTESSLLATWIPRHSQHDSPGPDEPLPSEPIGGTILRDAGFYTQALYGFRYGWAWGLRLEYASGKGASIGGRAADPLRSDRWRVSPLVVWHPTEYSRLRLQYNYDRAQFLPERDAHTVWLSAEILYGQHPAHKY